MIIEHNKTISFFGRDFKPGSHWSISSSQKFGARTEEYSDFFQGRTRIWENDLHPSIGSIHEGQNPLKRLKNVYGTSKGVGSNSSIDLEWETAEGKKKIVHLNISAVIYRITHL